MQMLAVACIVWLTGMKKALTDRIKGKQYWEKKFHRR